MPLRSGMLRVSAETVEGSRASDVFDAVVDERGDLAIVLFDLRPSASATAELADAARLEIRSALGQHEPLHTVVDALEMELANFPGSEAALAILRFSQAESRVEVLNAGMPPIAMFGPGSQLSMHPPLSTAVGRRVGDVHPYELVPLLWGSVWLMASDGLTDGSLEVEPVRQLCDRLDLANRGLALTAFRPRDLFDVLSGVLPSLRTVRDDASLMLAAADPTLRFEPGSEDA